jgi:hypothetical protein
LVGRIICVRLCCVQTLIYSIVWSAEIASANN